MKPTSGAVHYIDPTNVMINQAIIINLDSFYGPIRFYQNTLDSMGFKFSSCEDIYQDPIIFDDDGVWGDSETSIQRKSLIYVDAKTGQIEIHENSFADSNSVMGLIHLKRDSTYQTTPIMISDNVFESNSALMDGANAIKIEMSQAQTNEVEFEDDDMFCAAIQISGNTFSKNVG